ncbi:hypothetical protein HOC01_05260 [archaeon]|nr:hypothetical protein [archaeon]MBT6698219.1 hypothetical protein [archaeon]
MVDDDYSDLLVKYKEKIKKEFGEVGISSDGAGAKKIDSSDYLQFKKELYPTHFSLYEKACNKAEALFKLKVEKKQAQTLQKQIDTCHLNVTPSGVIALSFLAPLVFIFVGSLISFAVFQMMGLVLFTIIAGLAMIFALQKLPQMMADSWRIGASSQMVQSIFYLVTYMRHTSNLERAIAFAAEHLEPPLSLDFRKMLWDLENGRYSTIKESADGFLIIWKDWNKDFVESFHMVESSLMEPSDDRRLSLLDKSLDIILDGTYEGMLRYAHNLKSPMTMLNMMGIILPILGLVILPLVVSFMASAETSAMTMAIYISLLYNITLPVGVYYLGRVILSKRPSGYGSSDPVKAHKGLKKLQNVIIPLGKNTKIAINPLYFTITLLALTLFIGLSPLLIHSVSPSFEIQNEEGTLQMMSYVCPPEFPGCDEADKKGPYGLGAALLSVVLVAGLGVSWGLFYSLRSMNIIKIRQKTKALEDEFSSAMFQLGNRLGDGLPAEIAFSRVAETMRGSTSSEFFEMAEKNITKLGMGIEEALFDPRVGAVVHFPSKVIESSMKVMVESIKRGPIIAAQALLSMSRYIKEIHRVEERLKDLMAEVIGSMKAQVAFLTPAIAGIVVGITSMISTVLTKLSSQLSQFSGDGASGGFGNMLTIFGIGIPTYHFQIIVGIYVVQLAYILTVLANGIENGSDKLGERFALGKALTRSTLLYCAIAGIVIILFNLFAGVVLTNSLG